MKLILSFLLGISFLSASLIDLEAMKQDFVLETRKIEIPGYPFAFNPSIICYQGGLLLSFRIIPDRRHSFNSELGLVWLDEEFNPIGEPQLLDLRVQFPLVPCRAEDGRLIAVGDHLYMVYSDNNDPSISRKGFRVFITEIGFDGDEFYALNPLPLRYFEGELSDKREKNWSPFIYNGHLLLEYSQNPHTIFNPIPERKKCETVVSTICQRLGWNFGELRGGTPALLHEGEYLAFFHSSTNMASLHSDGVSLCHYFMGAYTFSASPPFELTKISPEPIVGPNFYRGPIYKPYWKPVRVVFPGGYVYDDDYIWLVYGRQDHEAWLAKLDKRALLQSLRHLK